MAPHFHSNIIVLVARETRVQYLDHQYVITGDAVHRLVWLAF